MNVKTLLVDDEKIDLEWMRRRVAGCGLPLEVAGTANSGFAALELLQKEPIDLILSDIRMPIMTGMDFARRAREIRPRVKIVFISGHEDFGYAKEALALHASGYLLKPVDDDELRGMLAQLCEEIRKERERLKAEIEVLSLAGQELLLRWLSGRFREPIDEHRESIRQVWVPIVLRSTAAVILEMDDMEWKTRGWTEEERQRITGDMAKFIGQFAAENGLGAIAASPSDSRLVLLAEGTEEEYTVLLEELIRAVAGAFPLTITAGCGKFVDDWRRLPESYRQAEAALNAKWLIGKNRLIRDVAEFPASGHTDWNLEEIAGRMLEAILAYDLVGIDDCLLRIFGRDRPLQRMDDVYNLIVRLTSRLDADLRQLGENLYELLEWESHQPAVLFRFETVDDILSWLRRRFFELSETLFMKRSRPGRKLIDEIIGYVRERIEMKVTLKEVAARFDFSPNYLGHLFKEETGKHFSDLLLELRMKRVCELLSNPSLKIYEIADRVGYKNIIYFNRQFKQWAGMSPGEYRKKHNI